MWRILKAELLYSWRLIAVYALFVPLIAVQQISEIMEDLSASYVLFILCFLTMQNQTTFRNKERRDHSTARLPARYSQLAWIRILLLILIWGFFWGLFVLISALFSAQIDFSSALISIAVLLIGFSIYYIIRDHLYPMFRKLGVTAQKTSLFLVLFLLGFSVLGFVFFVYSIETGEPPVKMDFLVKIARYFIYADTGDTIRILATSILFVILSVISFVKRKSHLG
jgi:hypothetical protein